MEGGTDPQAKEIVPPRGAKQPRVTHTQVDKRGESSVAVLV